MFCLWVAILFAFCGESMWTKPKDVCQCPNHQGPLRWHSNSELELPSCLCCQQVLRSQMGTSLSNSHRLRVHQRTTQLRIDPTSEPSVLSGGSGTLGRALGHRTNFLVTWHRVYGTCVASWRSSAADSFHPRGGPGGGGTHDPAVSFALVLSKDH